MKVIYHNDKTKIEQKNKKHWNFFMELNESNKKFWLNFPYELLKIIDEKKEGANQKKMTVEAESVMPLKKLLKKHDKKLPYHMCMELLFNIGNQIQTLESLDIGIAFIDLDDIIVINETTFLFINDKKIMNIKNNQIVIDTPLKKNMFFSPELKLIKKLPTKISYKSSFFSLGLIIAFCYFNFNLDGKEIKKKLRPIMTTKLYWALLRLLEQNPRDRYYLII